ncbi:facilitated trehalose transporter Tret1-like isoform X1 [Aphis gossypii]|uniref:facilitated trehalose transporter Tret1-like isoform X1 n=1 Tax=Aphis gossypii TaxID=80765 RepID=UPI0021593740|nr:facilitated trehalose transporter Tret1-like isoform X1 [Aphis gossypii]
MVDESKIVSEYTSIKYGWMATLAQLLATIAQSFLSIGWGMQLSISAIVIRHLQGNTESDFSISLTEASWYGSILFIIHPFGCFLSGVLQGRFGKKYCMIFANIPSTIGWTLLYLAQSSLFLYASTLLMGFSIGVGAGAVHAYIGEITEPRLRGAMASLTNTAALFGMLVSFTLSSFFDWRTVALLSTLCPIICILLIIFIPESPIWLIAKGKHEKAEKAICWLRGWVDSETVKPELSNLLHYNNVSGTIGTQDSNVVTNDSKNLLSKLAQFKKPSVYRPMKLIMIYFFTSYIVNLTPGKPFIGKIMTEVGLRDHQSICLIIFSILQMIGSVILILTIRRFRKRFLTLVTISINSALLLLFSVYIVAMKNNCIKSIQWIPLTLIGGIYLSGGSGVACIPWMLIGEVFPNKSRGIATGVCAGMSYLLLFALTKSYLTVEMFLSIEYSMCLFGCIGIFGLIYLYFYLPETENKTLLEIEEFFT